MRAALAACLLAACASEPQRGQVSVDVSDALQPVMGDGRWVVFADPDGDTRQSELDDMGHVDGELAAGGSVFLVRGGETHEITGYTDVQPGAAVAFGIIADPTTRYATLSVDGPLPPMTDRLYYGSPCGAGLATVNGPLRLDAACSAGTDVYVVACSEHDTLFAPGQFTEKCNGAIGYQRVHVSAIDGARVVLDPDMWVPFEGVTVLLAHAGGVVPSLHLTTAWGLTGFSDFDDPTRVVGPAQPAVGPTVVRGEVSRGGAEQQLVARLPAGETSLDLHAVVAPWVSTEASGWTADDDRGALVADALVTTYLWAGTALTLYSAAAASGSVRDAPALPRAITALFPTGLIGTAQPHLVRVVGADPTIDPQRLANIVMSGGDPGGTSYALTGPP